MTNRKTTIIALSALFTFLPLPFVGLRFFCRRLKNAPLGLDDWFVLSSSALVIGECVTLWTGATVGNLGSHETPGPDGLPVQDHAYFVESKVELISQILTILTVTDVKCSILLMYRRIFSSRRFRQVNDVYLVLVVSWGVAYLFATIFQCNPINTLWRNRLMTAVYCIKIQPFYLSNAISDMLIDSFILILPIPLVARLQMPVRRKLAVTGIFGLGTIIIVFGIIRIVFFNIATDNLAASRSFDISYITAPTQYWSLMQGGIGVICACLPTLGPLFTKDARSKIGRSLRLGSNKTGESAGGSECQGNQSRLRSKGYQRTYGEWSPAYSDAKAVGNSQSKANGSITPWDVELSELERGAMRDDVVLVQRDVTTTQELR